MMYLTNDKFLHFIFSFYLVMTFAHFTNLTAAYVITLAIGFAKEVYDHFSPKHNAELMDLVADFFGATLGLSVLLGLQMII